MQPKVTGTVWNTSLSYLIHQTVPCSGTLMPVFLMVHPWLQIPVCEHTKFTTQP